MKTAVIFDNFGPYHWARLRSAARVCDLQAIQTAGKSAEYAWENKTAKSNAEVKSVTLLEHGTSREIKRRELARRMDQALDNFRPQVVFVPGWSDKGALAALRWCGEHGVPAVVMSESTSADERRVWWKERTKQKLLGLFAAALVGGSRHREYLLKLGMSPDRIFLGYDAVDNGYFANKASEVRSRREEAMTQYTLPENYFLATARFIKKKNLPCLIQAYARYRELAGKSGTRSSAAKPWDLVLLGDGPLRLELCGLISKLRLDDCVHLAGFKQYDELPNYYGLARTLVHASTTEQWGLVINEAMASGLPVLVSNRCGCAPDLVHEGCNGFTFDPCNTEELARLMERIAALNFPLHTAGSESRRIIESWGPERFAQGLQTAGLTAAENGSKRPSWIQRRLLEGLLLH